MGNKHHEHPDLLPINLGICNDEVSVESAADSSSDEEPSRDEPSDSDLNWHYDQEHNSNIRSFA